jgi:hypothetical protein
MCGADGSRPPHRPDAGRQNSARVGVVLHSDSKQIVVHFVVPDTPAARSGRIHNGDHLIGVAQGEGRPIDMTGVPLEDAAALIRGPKGTVVTLTVVPEGKADKNAVTVALTRGEFDELSHFGDGKFPAAGTDAFELKAESLLPGGADYKLPAQPGHFVVVIFWADWYPPSIANLDSVQKLRDRYPEWKDEVELVAVSVDANKSAAQSFVQNGHKWNDILKVWAGQGVLKPFHIDDLPAVWIFDPQGKLLAAKHWLDIPKALKHRPIRRQSVRTTASANSQPSLKSKESGK